MRIVVLCHNLHIAGGYTVGINFVRAFKAVAGSHEFLITVTPGVGYEDIELPSGSEIYIYRGGRNVLKRYMFDCHELPKLLKSFKSDVIFAMGNLGVTVHGYKQAVLFHDSHLVYPSKYYALESKKYLFLKWLVKKRMQMCLKYTDLVFCQTPVTKKRFAETYHYPTEKISIMHNAVSEFSNISKLQAVVPGVLKEKSQFNMFFLAKFCAHKNFEILIDIFRDYRDELKDVRCIVTISPEQHPNAQKFLNNIKKYNLQDHIINVGPLKQEELAGYFFHSDAMFFPTFLESFSGTYIEAMHFGLPILTSDLDFAHYICKEAAVYFDPWDPADAVEKIIKVKNDLALRQELINKGKIHVKTFFKSWDQVASEAIKELECLVRSAFD